MFDSGYPPFNSNSGDDLMAANLGFKWERWHTLGVIIVVGAVFIALAQIIGSDGVSRHGWSILAAAVEGTGIATVSAAILSATIENWLLADFGKDMMLTIVGHRLPSDYRIAMKDEFIRLAEYKWVCEKHVLTVKIEPVAQKPYVRVITMIDRTIRNISGRSQSTKGLIHIDEWGWEEKSQITECSAELEGGPRYDLHSTETLPNLSILAQTAEIKVPSKKWVRVSLKSEEYKHRNDDLSYFFTAPTIRPTIDLLAPNEFVIQGGFGADEPITDTERHSQRETMDGILFPLQRIRVRWWPKNPI